MKLDRAASYQWQEFGITQLDSILQDPTRVRTYTHALCTHTSLLPQTSTLKLLVEGLQVTKRSGGISVVNNRATVLAHPGWLCLLLSGATLRILLFILRAKKMNLRF